jgi:hypothetical protein
MTGDDRMERQPYVEISSELNNLCHRVDSLEDWQKRQNGSIQRIESKVDKMIYLHFAELAMIIGGLVAILKVFLW